MIWRVTIVRLRQGLRLDHLLLGIGVALVIGLGVIPFGRLMLEGVYPGGEWDLSILRRVLTARSTWRATWHSLETSSIATLLSLILGSSFALVVVLTDLRRKAALVFCFTLPLMIPPQITALSWIQLLGPSSPLLNALGIAPPLGSSHPLYSREGIILLLGIQHAPLVFLSLQAGLRSVPVELVEAARSCGAGVAAVLRSIILPLMTPFWVAGAALAFVSGIGNFGIPAFLGIPASYTVLPTLIFQRLASFGPTILSDVAVLSILVGLIACLGIGVQRWLMRERGYTPHGTGGGSLVWELGSARIWVEGGLWLMVLLIFFIPLIALGATSLVPAYGVELGWDTITWENYREILLEQEATIRAFRNSLGLAGAAAGILMGVTGILAYFIVWRGNRWLDLLEGISELPYALPGVVLSIAMILVFLRPLPVINISLYSTIWIILLAYLARFMTLALRPVIGGFQQLDPSLEEAAQMSGAGVMARWGTILLPLAAPAVVAGGILVVMTAFNELTVSALLWTVGTETVGVMVFNLNDGGSTVLAAAMSVVTVGVIVGLMLFTQGISRWLPKGILPWSL